MKNHKPCHCERCEADRYNQECEGCGHHPTFWKTIVESPQWKLWEKENSKRMNAKPIGNCFDLDECRELGVMGEKHFQEFIKFVKTLK